MTCVYAPACDHGPVALVTSAYHSDLIHQPRAKLDYSSLLSLMSTRIPGGQTCGVTAQCRWAAGIDKT